MPTQGAITLTTPIEEVAGVGPRRGAAFRRLAIPSVAHLVHHLPHRHEFEAAESTIDKIVPGLVATARGEIASTRLAGRGRRKRFEAILQDASGTLLLTWFNQPFLHKRIHPGETLLVKGPAKLFENTLQIVNPHWETTDVEVAGAPGQSAYRPVYPASEELPSGLIERAVREVLDEALPLIEDHLSAEYRSARALPSLAESYRMMHAPANETEIRQARRRLAYDELLLLQIGLQLRRAALATTLHAPALRWSEEIDRRIRARIPFNLTQGQNDAVAALRADLTTTTPASRLLQGDVGSGKTVVALYAMLMAAASGAQSALMAPTELLAEQHFAVISKLLDGSQVRVELLTGSLSTADREIVEGRIAAGDATIVVGTHALLTQHVTFNDLALAVIDEQHRFGVHQRAALREKPGDEKSTPHVIVMTATPIPRTLALTVFGDLDVTTIRGLPPGRKPVRTSVIHLQDRTEAYERLRARIDEGGQGYVVAPVIDSGDATGLQDLETTFRRLEKSELASKRLAMVHGRLKRDERARIMEEFRAGRIDALIATTVIEVGVDIPNASIMVVEHAERFGLAQLHQLRGRVGRGNQSAECLLIADPETPDAKARMAAICEISDGFALAERDMEIRGPGEILGARQSGTLPFRAARIPDDFQLLELARRDAKEWLHRSPRLANPEDRLLKSRLLKAHAQSLGIADVA